MQLGKPRIPRSRIIAIDPDTGKSRSLTLSDATPEQFIAWLQRQLADQPASPVASPRRGTFAELRP